MYHAQYAKSYIHLTRYIKQKVDLNHHTLFYLSYQNDNNHLSEKVDKFSDFDLNVEEQLVKIEECIV